MYKQDKTGVDVRIDGMTGELSHDIQRAKDYVETMKKVYIKAQEEATQASLVLVHAFEDLVEAESELNDLMRIDRKLREAKRDIDRAYEEWVDWHKS